MANARTNYLTTKGRAVYPWLTQPDTKFHTEGVFKCGLRVSTDEAKEIMDAALLLAKEALGAKASQARMPWEQDPETGEVIFKTKSKYKPKFVDSKGNTIPEAGLPRMYGGSILKLKGSMTPYDTGSNAGVTMNLTAVQVIEPVENLEDTEGFAAVEDGFVVSNPESFEPTNNASSSDAEFTADF